MIKNFNSWDKINEVEELREFSPSSKYFNKIIEAYRKFPNCRPSRDPKRYANANSFQSSFPAPRFQKDAIDISRATIRGGEQEKGKRDVLVTKPANVPIKKGYIERDETLILADFVSSRSNYTYSELLISIIEEWYMWPDESRAKKVIIDYIQNDDDLTNLTFLRIIKSDPSLLAAGLASKSSMLKQLFVQSAAIMGITAVKESAINESFIGGFVIPTAIWDVVSSSYSYLVFGEKDRVEDSPLLSWIAPALPSDFKGLGKDDPIKSTYFSMYNTMMMLIYDAWNLCMGQDKYGSNNNPIIGFDKGGKNYLDYYMSEFCDSDELRNSFRSFISKLNEACLQDMTNSYFFEDCPFYYTGGKIVIDVVNKVKYSKSGSVSFEPENKKSTLRLSPEQFKTWIKGNCSKFRVTPSLNPFRWVAEIRSDGKYMPLSALGVKKEAKGDPLRFVSVTVDGVLFKTAKKEKPTLADFENILEYKKINGELKGLRVKYQNLSKGGSTVTIVSRDYEKDMENKRNEGGGNVSTSQKRNFKTLRDEIESETPSSFSGMGDI